ncbi:uncharacterized protein FPRO_12178 [Fusarium proliferatum ET1]|uniref:Uncharacterized protein n=1 Tax=Fusarium proliferatum (strain ET1) TaxID=1227346 RepID=A0A1L7W263_FUSPR|nr:uncharacterized protein FPRO_12178 [Fusarium proliferatum ET1]CZR46728.1 uncharacterized protein FPRO_12178 [Fusarium proliferatum ET1]
MFLLILSLRPIILTNIILLLIKVKNILYLQIPYII